MTSPISDILEAEWLKEFTSPGGLPTEFFENLEAALVALLEEAIGEDIDIEQWPKETEERWAAITANVVRHNIRSKLGITGDME
jgi:hypothetical protein